MGKTWEWGSRLTQIAGQLIVGSASAIIEERVNVETRSSVDALTRLAYGKFGSPGHSARAA
jgi:hypothetical protein